MSTKSKDTYLEQTRSRFMEIIKNKNLLNTEVSVLARPLTPEEAIGTPGRRDFPIIEGKERVVESKVLGAKGHAFTDSAREFTGTLNDVLALELSSNQNRAIYIATLNATLNYLKKATATVHCKDDDPEDCAKEIAALLLEKYGRATVGLIGMNPAIAERLVETFGIENVHFSDLNHANIGQQKFGVEIWDGHTLTRELIERCDVVVFTGTTLVNDSFDQILDMLIARGKAYYVFGVTAAAVCTLLGFERLCPRGRDS
ncbi:MAG: hypothetical protein JRJ87_12320 [Deltaproteobacteria bacterium]|nr:hypothetical protein [Deltaproteobacteria bacterium]